MLQRNRPSIKRLLYLPEPTEPIKILRTIREPELHHGPGYYEMKRVRTDKNGHNPG